MSVGADELLPLRPAPQSASPPRLVLLATPTAQLRGVNGGRGMMREVNQAQGQFWRLSQRMGAAWETVFEA